MKIQEFKLERTMSLYQHEVEYDLTESGVSSLFPREFVDRDEWNNMYDFLQLRYVHTAGTQTLTEMIGTYYDNAAPANIFVTNGSAEAQFALSAAMFEPMDEIVYTQRCQTYTIDEFDLGEDRTLSSRRLAASGDASFIATTNVSIHDFIFSPKRAWIPLSGVLPSGPGLLVLSIV